MRRIAKVESTASLVRSFPALWKAACRNPFLLGVRDGSLPRAALESWLVQNSHFLDGLFTAQARILALAPRADRVLLTEGLRDVLDYLAWHERRRRVAGIDPDEPVHPVCRAYVDFLLTLGFEPYPVGLVALWAQYAVYLEGWRRADPPAMPFRDVVRTWVSPRYAALVRRMRRAADTALAAAAASERERAKRAFELVLHYEIDFWIMTMAAPRA